MSKRVAWSLLTGALLFAGCSSGRETPTSPSSSTSTDTASSASATSGPSSLAGARPGLAGGGLLVDPGRYDSQVVTFPPRNQSFDFGRELNDVYREELGRSPVATFVDLEGWIVWIQEYLRYRVNGCSHTDASFRVGLQIGGAGVPPVCAEAPPGTVNFPPRNESFAFGLDLNATYRDVLRRGSVSAYVDLEGWIVWISEYLRYRVNNCSHTDAAFRVGVQIGGGGVPPTCTGGGGGGGSAVLVRPGTNACACWIGTITVEIDGVNRGTMTCTSSLTVGVSPGTHTLRACDATGCATDTFFVAAGETYDADLSCNAAASRQLRRSAF